jgi:hypothetical protein
MEERIMSKLIAMIGGVWLMAGLLYGAWFMWGGIFGRIETAGGRWTLEPAGFIAFVLTAVTLGFLYWVSLDYLFRGKDSFLAGWSSR